MIKVDLEDVMWRAGCDGDEVDVSGPEAQALIMRLEVAENRLDKVREIADDIKSAGYVLGLARNLYSALGD